MDFLIASATPPLAIGRLTASAKKGQPRSLLPQRLLSGADCVARPGAALRPRRVVGAAREQ